MRQALTVSFLLAILAIGAVAAPAQEPADPWDKPINASINGGLLRDIVRMLLKDSGIGYAFAQPPNDPDDYYVSAEFKDVPLKIALQKVLRAANCYSAKKGNAIYIASKPARGKAKYLPVSQGDEEEESAAQPGDFPPAAQLGDLNIRLTLYTRDGTITAGEPLIAKVVVTNRSRHPVSVYEGNSQGFNRHVIILDAMGKIVAESPAPRFDEDGMSAVSRLAPGQAKSHTIILTGLYSFENPGKYTVRVQQLGDSPDMKVLAERSASLHVLPYDAKRLSTTVDELYDPLCGSLLPSGEVKAYLWSAGVRSKAVMSVRDNLALPWLKSMAYKWCDDNAVRAMLRIGTERAKAMVAELASRDDKVGKAARSAQERAGEDADVAWDMNWY